MIATIEHLRKVAIFEQLIEAELQVLQPQSQVRQYLCDEIVLHEGDRLPTKLHALLSGRLQVKKTTPNGRETLLRILLSGEIFAAPALFGDGVAPATIVAETNCELLFVDRAALLLVFQQNPEVAIGMLATLTQRLNQLHQTIHGLVSERAIVRLAQLILSTAAQHGTDANSTGNHLKVTLSHYHIARTIGISYEECVRLIRSLKSAIAYQRGGHITILNAEELNEIAIGMTEN
ncbi:MAG: Crp/Fnr family transcriptional regulator [Leptolyngbyaceae cyanobacterium SU_3_3]|nr:Crp/Fnr family transcriptional regulator [Leptolyngbyaceae cyanobacterium SU_3_3]NJR49809.1 Crp/Fnr family transcriptional regulator [Leptolyngbyaceae cyanobacterium CSU_1_3]